jgi:hypothetical protein
VDASSRRTAPGQGDIKPLLVQSAVSLGFLNDSAPRGKRILHGSLNVIDDPSNFAALRIGKRS